MTSGKATGSPDSGHATVTGVLEMLRADEGYAAWLADLEAFDTSDSAQIDVMLPSVHDLPAVLVDLAIPHEDVNAMTALRDVMVSDPEWSWLLDRCVRRQLLGADAIDPSAMVPWTRFPEAAGAAGRYFFPFAAVAALPHTRALHQARGIPEDVSRRILADIGRHVAVHRKTTTGGGGMVTPGWITHHLRGEIYQLGRLQFERGRLHEKTAAGLAEKGLPAAEGDLYLSVHIPDFSGPLTRGACDESLARARDFFPRYFPEEDYALVLCTSWLLDPQLKQYLGPHSNVIAFQDWFQGIRQLPEANDGGPVGFVFGDPDFAPADLPRRTSVERAVGDHLRAGRHWHGGVGWLPWRETGRS